MVMPVMRGGGEGRTGQCGRAGRSGFGFRSFTPSFTSPCLGWVSLLCRFLHALPLFSFGHVAAMAERVLASTMPQRASRRLSTALLRRCPLR